MTGTTMLNNWLSHAMRKAPSNFSYPGSAWERAALKAPPLETFKQRCLVPCSVGGGPVPDVEVIADVAAVGADHRPLAAQHRSDRAGHDAVPVQVAAAVKVAAARHANRRVVRVVVRQRQNVCA